jgi:hypothetical protein
MTTAAIATGNGDLAVWALPAGSMAGPLTEEGVLLVHRAWGDRAERVQEFADAVAAEAGKPIDEVLDEVSGDRKGRQLLGEAVAASVDAVDEWKIRMLAKAFVRGAQDGAVVDEMRMLIDVLRPVEVAEVRFLAVFGKGRNLLRLDDVEKADPGLAPVALPLATRLTALNLLRNTIPWQLSDLGHWCVECLGRIGSLPEPGDH